MIDVFLLQRLFLSLLGSTASIAEDAARSRAKQQVMGDAQQQAIAEAKFQAGIALERMGEEVA